MQGSITKSLVATVLMTMAGFAMADITLYSGQHKGTTEAVVKAFEAKTGVKVDVRAGKSAQMAGLILEEGDKTPADVFYSEQLPPLVQVAAKGMLAPLDEQIIKDNTIEGVPHAPDKNWIALDARARVVVYDPSKVDPKDFPKSVLEFPSEKWEGRLGYVPTSGAFKEQVIAITKMKGRDVALKWLKDLKKYGKIYPKNKAALAAVEKGEVEVALINNYYWYGMVKEVGADKVKSKLFFFKNKGPGALVTYSGAGVLSTSKNMKEANQFVDFLASKEGQEAITASVAEYPLRKDVESPYKMLPYGDLNAPVLTVTTDQEQKDATALIQEAGF